MAEKCACPLAVEGDSSRERLRDSPSEMRETGGSWYRW